jgi:GNAT superfamily N-acetyltransferase
MQTLLVLHGSEIEDALCNLSCEEVVMFFLEQSITKPYWEPTQEYIWRRIRNGKYADVGKTGVVKIIGGKQTVTFAIHDHGFPVAWLYLRARPGWRAHEVHQAFTLKKYRGQGLAQRLYKAAINTDGILLASGETHTKYSAALWKKFIAKKQFNIWAHDFKNTRSTSTVEVEDGEIQCALPIYLLSAKYDVRFVAERKR